MRIIIDMNKKIITIALIVILHIVTLCINVKAKEPFTLPSQIATALIEVLPPGWKCISDNSTLCIIHEEEITLLNPISLPSAIEKDKLLKDYGIKSQFIILLRFTPKLTIVEYNKIKKLRDDVLNKINTNKSLSGKERWDRTNQIVEKYSIPVYYTSSHSIYLYKTDRSILEVYPETIKKERDIILKEIEKLLNKY